MTVGGPGGIRRGPLTWGQQLLWLGYLATPPERRNAHTVVQIYQLPETATLPGIEAALALLVERHETLRTTYHRPDGGPAVQVVHPPLPVPLQRLDAPDAGAAEALAAQTGTFLKGEAFDLAEAGSLRAAVVCAGPVPVTILLAAHHIAVDGWSWHILHREFDAAVRAHASGAVLSLPGPPWQPLDEAAYEESGPGRRANAAALLYWDRQIAAMPDRVLPGTGGEAGQYIAVLESPALATALASLRQYHQVNDSTLMLAAFGAVLAAATGREQSTLMTMSSNRHGDRTRDMVACLAQYTVVALDLRGDPSVTELVKRAAAATITAYRHGHYDFAAMKAHEADLAKRRGLRFSQQAGLNFKHYGDRGTGSPAPAAARAGTSSAARIAAAGPTCAQGVALLNVRTEPDLIVLELLCDGAAIARDDMLGLVRALETLLTGAAANPRQRLSAFPELAALRPALGEDWALADNCWVNLREVERAILACPAVTAARAFRVDDTDRPTGSSLVAYVAVAGGPPTQAALRRYVTEAAGRGLPVIAPHRLVACQSAPADSADLIAWQRQRVLTTGPS